MDVLKNVINRRDRNADLIRQIILRDIFHMPDVGIVEVPEFDLYTTENKFIKPYFRFERLDILRLARVPRIPNDIKTRSEHFVGTAVEGLCILLRRLAYLNRFSDLEHIFKRSPAALSKIYNFVAKSWSSDENIGNLP